MSLLHVLKGFIDNEKAERLGQGLIKVWPPPPEPEEEEEKEPLEPEKD